MTTVQLEFNGLKWTLCEDLHVMCKFSKYFLELVEKTDKNSKSNETIIVKLELGHEYFYNFLNDLFFNI